MSAERRTASAILIVLVVACGCAQVRQGEAPNGSHVRLMTYNVNYGLPPQWGIGVIEQCDADVVCLQETTAAWEQAVREQLGQRYPHMMFKNEPVAGGMAVLSRRPIEEIFYDQPPGGWFHGWALKTQTDIGDVQLLNVHLHPPLSERGSFSGSAYFSTQGTRRGEIEYLHQKLSGQVPTIVLGDFNENDSGNALSYLAEQGFADCLGKFDRTSKTWRWQTGVLSLSGRYDHILYSQPLHCYHARVLTEGESDHLPVVAVLGVRHTN